ncbi:MAG: amidase [Actinomycetota bacterium]|nr:amidase [Actinomycetota bacterium]
MTELPESAAEMAAGVAAGRVSPVELVQRVLQRMNDWQAVTNAFSQLMFRAALEEALALERAVAAGEAVGPLAGVPVAVKDLFDVAGCRTTGCSRAYRDNWAEADAEVVRRLRAAGAIVVGKTNMHELAAGATNLVSACGPTANPWDPLRITGGSSGGSAAALAAGVVPIALGTDTGGSIRIPSSFCGVAGLKPTTGALPLDGVLRLAPSLDCPGPMAGSVGDLQLAWQVVSGQVLAAPPDLARGAGVLGGYFADRIHPEVVGGVRAVADALASTGVEIVMVDGRGIDDAPQVWLDIGWTEFHDVHGHLLEHPELLEPLTVSYLEYGRDVPPARRMEARRRAEEIRSWFAVRLRDVDVLVAPSTPFPAPPADATDVEVRAGERLGIHGGATSVLTRPVNLAGLPALALPSGWSRDGLPLGAQLIGRRGSEAMLLATAALLEELDERFRVRRAPGPPPP